LPDVAVLDDAQKVPPQSFSPEDTALLASRLKNARKAAKLTQSELARRVGKPQTFVAKYETLERELAFFEVLALCHALGVCASDLVRSDVVGLLGVSEGGSQ